MTPATTANYARPAVVVPPTDKAGRTFGGAARRAMYSLMVGAKLNDIGPRAWLANVLGRIADHPTSGLHELLPWNSRKQQTEADIAASAAACRSGANCPPCRLDGYC